MGYLSRLLPSQSKFVVKPEIESDFGPRRSLSFPPLEPRQKETKIEEEDQLITIPLDEEEEENEQNHHQSQEGIEFLLFQLFVMVGWTHHRERRKKFGLLNQPITLEVS